jgi:hypothetical protein
METVEGLVGFTVRTPDTQCRISFKLIPHRLRALSLVNDFFLQKWTNIVGIKPLLVAIRA